MTASITADATLTVLDYLIEHLRARDVQIDGTERPAAILWTDPKAEWGVRHPDHPDTSGRTLGFGRLGSRHAHGAGDLDPMPRRPDTRRALTAW